MLISVHIPKTGGTTFQDLLMARYGKKMLLDYADQPMRHNNYSRNKTAVNFRNHFQENSIADIECIHGHFLPLKYTGIKEKSFVTWFRDPVELLVSRYHHHQRHLQKTGVHYTKWVSRPDLSLYEFAQIKHFHNVYAKFMLGMQLSDFKFIGITEHYDSSIHLFNCMFGENIKSENLQLNRNPGKQSRNYSVDENVRDIILKNNQLDMKIYSAALQIFHSNLTRYQ